MRVITCFLLLVICMGALGQANDSYMHKRYIVERIGSQAGDPNATIPTLPLAPPKVEGDAYLNRSYDLFVFQLYDGKILERYAAKLDLKLNEFDIITKQGIRVLKGNLVKSFIFFDSVTRVQSNYVNVKEWNFEGDKSFTGFFQILSEGDITLVKRNDVIFKKADFHPALNVGSKDHRYIKKEFLYYVQDGKVVELPAKRALIKIFGDKENELTEYVANNHLNLSKENDLVSLFNLYNKVDQ